MCRISALRQGDPISDDLAEQLRPMVNEVRQYMTEEDNAMVNDDKIINAWMKPTEDINDYRLQPASFLDLDGLDECSEAIADTITTAFFFPLYFLGMPFDKAMGASRAIALFVGASKLVIKTARDLATTARDALIDFAGGLVIIVTSLYLVVGGEVVIEFIALEYDPWEWMAIAVEMAAHLTSFFLSIPLFFIPWIVLMAEVLKEFIENLLNVQDTCIPFYD